MSDDDGVGRAVPVLAIGVATALTDGRERGSRLGANLRVPPARPSRQRRSSSVTAGARTQMMSEANVPKSVPMGHENGPRGRALGPFSLVAGTGFEPATSGL
jgi:hypothetical protein